jgi:hypothetical protein
MTLGRVLLSQYASCFFHPIGVKEPRVKWPGVARPLIPRLFDQNRWAQLRKPMDMMVQG